MAATGSPKDITSLEPKFEDLFTVAESLTELTVTEPRDPFLQPPQVNPSLK